MGAGDNGNLLYVIDYGLAKKYRDPQTRMHIAYRDNKRLTGTARYASLATHLGIEQSRRDDMESLGYTVVYLLKEELPWQGVQAENRHDKYNLIKEKKQCMKVEDICKDLPAQFSRYIYYCRSLKFEDKPDYAQLRKMFKDLFYEKHYDCNFSYDWVLLKALTGLDRVGSGSFDGTNLAEGPNRMNQKIQNEGDEMKVTDLSTPKTVCQPMAPCQPTVPQTPPQASMQASVQASIPASVPSLSNDTLKARDRPTLPEMDIMTEEAKVGFFARIARQIPKKEWGDKRTVTLMAIQKPLINPFESSSCDFKENDIVEDLASVGTLYLSYNNNT